MLKIKKPGIYLARTVNGFEHLVTVEGFSCDYAYARVFGNWRFYETDGLSASGFDQLVFLLLPTKDTPDAVS